MNNFMLRHFRFPRTIDPSLDVHPFDLTVSSRTGKWNVLRN